MVQRHSCAAQMRLAVCQRQLSFFCEAAMDLCEIIEEYTQFYSPPNIPNSSNIACPPDNVIQ